MNDIVSKKQGNRSTDQQMSNLKFACKTIQMVKISVRLVQKQKQKKVGKAKSMLG